MRRPLSILCLSSALCFTALPAHAADGAVAPIAPTFVDECGVGRDTVTIPKVDGVRYFVDLTEATVELTPGHYAGVAFLDEDDFVDEELEDVVDNERGWNLPDVSATIRAEAADGFVLAGDAPTRFDVSLSSVPCASTSSRVEVTTDCGNVTFTNPVGNPQALVTWGETGSEADPDELLLAPGETKSVTTDAEQVFWMAHEEDALEDDHDWGATLGGTVPDFVATQDDRDLLRESAELIDLMHARQLGVGFVEIRQECATATPGPGGPDQAPPEIPAVVQTDGFPAADSSGTPLLLGTLAGLGSFFVLRPHRRS